MLRAQAITSPSFSQFKRRKINQEVYRDVAFTVPPTFPKIYSGNRYEDATQVNGETHFPKRAEYCKCYCISDDLDTTPPYLSNNFH
jgi:hypothetical protein